MKNTIRVRMKNGKIIHKRVDDIWDVLQDSGNVKSYAASGDVIYRVVDRDFDGAIWARHITRKRK